MTGSRAQDNSRTLRTLLAGGGFFESPRWRGGCWWVSDHQTGRVSTVQCDGEASLVLLLDQRPSGLGWLPDGSLLVVSMRDQRVLRRNPDGSLSVHAELSSLAQGPANDMVVDSHGRAYVGCIGFNPRTEAPRESVLIKVDAEGGATVAASGLLAPNGAVITADGTSLIVGESLGNRYSEFSIGPDGSLVRRSEWCRFGRPPDLDRPLNEVLALLSVMPDGCAMDAAGAVWVADALSGWCRRIARGGQVLDEIAPPQGLRYYACMLGGDTGDTLLLCAAPAQSERGPRDAILVTTQVTVPRGAAMP